MKLVEKNCSKWEMEKIEIIFGQKFLALATGGYRENSNFGHCVRIISNIIDRRQYTSKHDEFWGRPVLCDGTASPAGSRDIKAS